MTQAQNQTLQENLRIGVYEIKDVIHIGEFSIIYRAWNHHLNAPQVLKEYFPRKFAARAKDRQTAEAKSDNCKTVYETGLDRFIEQAEMLTEIDHINLMRVYNLLEFNGTAYHVMDYEDVKPLADFAAPLSGEKLQAIVLALLGGLQELHTRNTIHGAIHPGNVLVRANGDAVLTGYAADRLEVDAWHYQALHEGYSPAEQYEPGDRNRFSSDFYALGATAYSCITGAQPVPACYRVLALSRGEADPLRPLFRGAKPEFSEQLLQTVEWMLSPEYEKRPDSARAAITALKEDLKEGKISVRFDKHSEPDVNLNKFRLIDRPRAMVWIGGIAAVAVFAVVGLTLIINDEQAPETLAANTKLETDSSVEKIVGKSLDNVSDQPKERVVSAPSNAQPPTKQRVDPRLPTRIEVSAKKSAIPKTPDGMPSVETALFDTDLKSVIVPAISSKADISAKRIEPDYAAALSKDRASKIGPKEQWMNSWIDQQLAAAKDDFNALRLTTPLRTNALMRYQAILAVEPRNTAALNGVRQIIERYVMLIEKAKQAGNFRAVKLYLKRVESVLPSVVNKTSTSMRK